ncbi:MAG: flagellar protein FlaG [Chitinispirillaceae bacterium]
MKIGSVTAASLDSAHLTPGNSSGATEVQQQTATAAAEIQKKTESAQQSVEKEWELMEKPIEQANQSLKAYDRRIDRSVHDVTRTVMYTITDTKTNEVIAEYPPKKIQDMIAKMWELAGLFVDEKA